MSTEPATRPRESPSHVILLFPLRAIERARGWRRLGLLLVYVMIALPILAHCCGGDRSSPACPMSVTRSMAMPPAAAAGIAEDRNAFVPYRRAAEQFRDMNTDEGNRSRGPTSCGPGPTRHFAAGSPSTRKRSRSCVRVRNVPRRPRAAGPARRCRPRRGRQEIIRRLSWIGDAALFEAGRLRAEGDPAGAWALLRAAVRASRDMERAVPTAWCRTTAIILVQYARRAGLRVGQRSLGRRRPLAAGPRRPGRRRGATRRPCLLLSRGISGRLESLANLHH